MTPNDRSQLRGDHDQRGDEKACLHLGFGADFPHAFDHDDALQPRPGMALTHPIGIMEDSRRSGFDAAMITIDRLVLSDRRILKAVSFLFCHEYLDILAQGALVSLECEDIISLLVDDLFGNVTLAAYRVDGHDGPFYRQHVQQLGDGHDLVRLVRHFDLAQHKALTGREGRNHMNGGFLACFLIRPAQRLAVDRDHLGRSPRQ